MTQTLLGSFEWWRWPTGATVVDGVVMGRAAAALVESPMTRCRPLDDSGLFLRFAHMSSAPESVERFASEHGPLGVKLIRWPKGGLEESLEAWKASADALADAVELWEGLRSRRVSPDGWTRLSDLVAEQLNEPNQAVLRGSGSRLTLASSDEPGRPLALRLVPGTLIGAMWLQFAFAVDGGRDYRACPQCTRWFELSPDTARTNRVYCSDACRSRAYRERLNGAQKED